MKTTRLFFQPACFSLAARVRLSSFSLAMSILEALKGSALEIRDTPGGLAPRLATTARLAGTIARELSGLPLLAPWAARTALARARAPPPGRISGPAVALARDVRYGPGPRQLADVWVPPGWSDAASGAPGPGATTCGPSGPVALLVHGGVWSSGDKWTLGPAAAALAAASGAAVAVPNYSLWPAAEGSGGGEGLDAGAVDVTAALGWALAGGVAGAVGGAAASTPRPSSPRVTLVGHSAGAHLAALAALAWSAADGSDDKKNRSPHPPSSSPAAVVSLAGVFDLAAHYEYERGRGVHYLSTMARAAGGAVGWDGREEGKEGASTPAAPTPRQAAGMEACSPTAILEGRAARWAPTARPGLGRCLAARPARLPAAWLLIAGGADGTVPASQSAAFAGALRGAGIQGVRCEVVPGVGHVDFVTGWGGEWAEAVATVVRGD